MRVFWVLGFLFLSTLGNAASPICQAQLLPPTTIQRYFENFLSRVIIELAAPEKKLEEASVLSRTIFERIKAGQIPVTLRDGMDTPFQLRIKYGFQNYSHVAELDEIYLSTEVVQFLHDHESAQIELVARPHADEASFLRAWVGGLAEVREEKRIDDVNIFSQLFVKQEWQSRVDHMLGREPSPALTEDEFARGLWPNLETSHEQKDYRKIILGLGLSYLVRNMGDVMSFVASVKKNSLPAESLTQAMLIARGGFKMGYFALGERAANVYFAERLLDSAKLAPLRLPSVQLKKLHEEALRQFEETYLQLQMRLNPTKKIILIDPKGLN